MPKIKYHPILQKFPKRFSQKECLKLYEIWYHPEYYKMIKNKEKISYVKFKRKYNEEPFIEGISFANTKNSNKKIFITPLGKCYFDTRYFKIKTVPLHYSRKVPKKDLKSSICEETPKRLLDLEKNGLNYRDWESQTEHYLQIKDIVKLKKGDKLKFIILTDYVDNIKNNKLYKPKDFYKYWVTYTHDKDLKGTIQYPNYRTSHKIITKKSLNNKENKSNMKKSKKNNSLTKPTDLEFIINIKDDKLHNSLKKINKNEAPWGWGLWVALENGYLQINGKKKKWTTFPKDTPIGIGGPLILWDKLDKLPNIYNLYLKIYNSSKNV